MDNAGQDDTRRHRFLSANWIVMLLAIAASAFSAVTLGQDASWDVRNYHYYAGYALLDKPPQYDFAPAQMQSFFNPLLHVITYPMLAHLPSRMAAAAMGALQGLNFYIIFLISQTLFRSWKRLNRWLISLGTAFTGFYGAANISELGATFGDNLVSILVLSALLIILRYLLREKSAQPSVFSLWIGGVLLGIAAGAKLTVAIFAAAALLSVFLLPSKRRLRQFAAFVAAMTTGFITTYGFWGISLYFHYQSPFFPYLNNIFHSPYHAWTSVLDDRFLPRNWMQTLFYPFFLARKNHLVAELDLRDVRLALCYIAIVVLVGAGFIRLLKDRGRARERKADAPEVLTLRFLGVFIAISYAMWQSLFSIYRYQVVLEFLVPAFLAVALARFLKTERRALFSSLSVFACICMSVIWPDWGRQKFDDDFLKVRIPLIQDLAQSVVLMAGGNGTSYIVPQFPPSTRFVRVFSNLTSPGGNPNLDKKISATLSQYGAGQTLVYVANPDEIDHTRDAVSYYGVSVDDTACFEVKSGARNQGYLCRAVNGWRNDEKKPPGPPWNRPEFQRDARVWFTAAPDEAVAGKSTVTFQMSGIKALAMDMLYTCNGMRMPPVRGYSLDSDQSARVFLSSLTEKGFYHYIGVRASDEPNKNLWYQVDATLRIK